MAYEIYKVHPPKFNGWKPKMMLSKTNLLAIFRFHVKLGGKQNSSSNPDYEGITERSMLSKMSIPLFKGKRCKVTTPTSTKWS